MHESYRIMHGAALVSERIAGLFELGDEFLRYTAYDLSARLRKIAEQRQSHSGIAAEMPVAFAKYHIRALPRSGDCCTKSTGTSADNADIALHISDFHNKNTFQQKSAAADLSYYILHVNDIRVNSNTLNYSCVLLLLR